ncbi:MAG TPA: MFS transporter [Candidatus Saccharimonadales bacterium]|nr:MFS transporter [Candidatus Saccharimonadales bacterium]
MQEKLTKYTHSTFSSLKIRNYRLYFIGQGISRAGTWVQTIAQTWLIFQLTGSGTYIGLLTAVQFIPILVLGPLGGLVADRFPKLRLLYMTQIASMVLAFAMAALVLSGIVQVWMVFVVAILLGLVKVVDTPTRQTFIMEMVGREHIVNAVTLNSIEVNMARIIGPAIGGGVIASIGIGYCFLIDGVSYLAVVLCQLLMRRNELQAAAPVAKSRGQLAEGFRYVWHTPVLRNVLLMMVVVGTLAYEFPVVLPIFASETFHDGASGYALLMGAMGLGAVIGGMVTANRKNPTPHVITLSAFGFGLSLLLTAASPHIIIAALMMVIVGVGSISFTSVANSTLQLESTPAMRGRVMALWTMAFLGSTPVGGPIIGYVSEHYSARVGLLMGGMSAICAGLFGLRIHIKQKRARRVALVTESIEEDKY